ncbi:Fur family transcriptional regulator [Yinghuangia aomiensis]
MTTANSPARGRSTRQRTAVGSALLDEVEDFRSAQDLHDLLKQRGDSVGLTTVYRTLQALADAGRGRRPAATPTAKPSTGAAACGHHHHLVCRACGRTVEVEGPAVERWAGRIAAEHGYTDVSHELEIFGTCGPCTLAARG